MTTREETVGVVFDCPYCDAKGNVAFIPNDGWPSVGEWSCCGVRVAVQPAWDEDGKIIGTEAIVMEGVPS